MGLSGLFHDLFVVKICRRDLLMRLYLVPTYVLLVCVIIYLPYSYIIRTHHQQTFHEHVHNLSQTFYNIDLTGSKVFTAYYDNRGVGLAEVKVLGFKRPEENTKLYCKLYLPNQDSFCIRENAKVEYLNDDQNKLMDEEVFFICPVPPGVKPVAVVLTAYPGCLDDRHLIPVVHPVASGHSYELAACLVIPDAILEHQEAILLQQIEVSFTLGASAAILYISYMTLQIERVLDYYRSRNQLTVVMWDIGDRASHDSGRTSALNDCVYRNMGKVKYLMFPTLDSVVIPSNADNLLTLLEGYDVPHIGILKALPVSYHLQPSLAESCAPDTGTLHSRGSSSATNYYGNTEGVSPELGFLHPLAVRSISVQRRIVHLENIQEMTLSSEQAEIALFVGDINIKVNHVTKSLSVKLIRKLKDRICVAWMHIKRLPLKTENLL